MAAFARGIGRIATFGFYDDILKSVKAVFTRFAAFVREGFIKNIQTPLLDQFNRFKTFISNSFIGQIAKNFDTFILTPIKNFFGMGTEGRGFFQTIKMLFQKAVF